MNHQPKLNFTAWLSSAKAIAAFGFSILASALPASAETRTFDRVGFDEIQVSSGLEMVIGVGPAFSVTAEGEGEALDTLVIELKGSTLVVDRQQNWRETLFSWSRDQQRVQLTVTLPLINALEAKAGVSVEISGVMSGPLHASASSGSSLNLVYVDIADIVLSAHSGASILASGTCGELAATAKSGASISAGSLLCETVAAEAKSGASVVVNGNALSLSAASGGSVVAQGGSVAFSENARSGGSISVSP